MDKHAWIGTLKEGDEVAVDSGFPGDAPRIATVERVTATQVIAGASRFRRKDGYRIGDSGYRSSRIIEATPAVREAALRHKLALRFAYMGRDSWLRLSLPALRAVADAVDAPAPSDAEVSRG